MLIHPDKAAKIIGLMSGTSHDGVDAAIVEIMPGSSTGNNASADRIDSEISIELIKHLHRPFSKALREEIQGAFSGNTEHICRLNFKLGEVFAKSVLSLIEVSGLSPKDIDAIASHGQTIYHIPPSGSPSRRTSGSTLQIGEASVIAERTGIMTISDFRTRDMAAGGHGAPLVPLADYLLFSKKGLKRAVLNIGGIANVTLVEERIDGTIAFDTGPGNSLIDESIKYCSSGRLSFDRHGSVAESGRPDKGLLKELLKHPYLKKRPPKTTGREVFGAEMVKDIFSRYGRIAIEDILSTLTHFTATSIYRAIIPYGPDEVIVTGGGTKNRFLMKLICGMFEAKEITVNNISKYGIPPEAKEAVSFALLGYQTLNLRPGNLPSATGAHSKVILGKITLP
ncbi:Anhydro-N-acetylmuramic acid kinase [hydrothermal vent metagenome]|uniref:Anhydro-N-acetylmuramic acid kinase n=1 Tax=hydrothermal vent metagenome TaxID=652676 RepID=A0A3B1CUR9_9ZZZZ